MATPHGTCGPLVPLPWPVSMRVWIDQDLCTGDGLCVDHCPDVFTQLEDGIAYVTEGGTTQNDPGGSGSLALVPPRQVVNAIHAAEACPASASSSRSTPRWMPTSTSRSTAASPPGSSSAATRRSQHVAPGRTVRPGCDGSHQIRTVRPACDSGRHPDPHSAAVVRRIAPDPHSAATRRANCASTGSVRIPCEFSHQIHDAGQGGHGDPRGSDPDGRACRGVSDRFGPRPQRTWMVRSSVRPKAVRRQPQRDTPSDESSRSEALGIVTMDVVQIPLGGARPMTVVRSRPRPSTSSAGATRSSTSSAPRRASTRASSTRSRGGRASREWMTPDPPAQPARVRAQADGRRGSP